MNTEEYKIFLDILAQVKENLFTITESVKALKGDVGNKELQTNILSKLEILSNNIDNFVKILCQHYEGQNAKLLAINDKTDKVLEKISNVKTEIIIGDAKIYTKIALLSGAISTLVAYLSQYFIK